VANVGFLGLGIMGAPMTLRLIRAGHREHGLIRSAKPNAVIVDCSTISPVVSKEQAAIAMGYGEYQRFYSRVGVRRPKPDIGSTWGVMQLHRSPS
jgi:3-hydroxyisobutyrate dehydrogenase-like beta-hydroxyacid dehydrogenase